MRRDLDLRPADETLALYQRRFFDESLPAALSAKAFERFDASRFDDAAVAWGRRAWEARTLDEYRSHASFCEFLLETSSLGLSWDAVSGATRLVRDEARHVELCRRLVSALGGSDQLGGEPSWVQSDASRPLLERVLRTTMGSLCLGETISAAMLAATLKVTKVPLARRVLEALTRDESFHSQFGWRLFALLWPLANQRMKRRAVKELREDLKIVRELAFEGVDDAEDPKRKRNPFGDLTRAEREAAFARSLERDVLRRFQGAGVSV
jgi:hypothetical protein